MASRKIPELTRARWVGPYGRLYDGTELVPHETVLEVGPHEAVASDHWHVLDRALEKAIKEQAEGLTPVESPLAPPLPEADPDAQEGDA